MIEEERSDLYGFDKDVMFINLCYLLNNSVYYVWFSTQLPDI